MSSYCPKCQEKALVIDSRQEEGYVKRRKSCLNIECQYIWNTYEVDESDFKKLTKRTTKKYRACIKCNRALFAWKFCKEHFNEFHRMDMQERREFFRKFGFHRPRKKKGTK